MPKMQLIQWLFCPTAWADVQPPPFGSGFEGDVSSFGRVPWPLTLLTVAAIILVVHRSARRAPATSSTSTRAR